MLQITRLIPLSAISVIFAVFILILLSLQYPATLIFPMGGDSPPYIWSAQRILNAPANPEAAWQAIKTSRYPLTVAIFTSLSALNPIDDWPIRFIWVITLGQVTSGLALGWMLYRLAEHLPGKPRWQMACIGMAVWAFTPISLNAHFRAGTLGQLWSLTFLLLFFERLLAQKPKGAAFMLLAALLSHPITAVVITLVMTVATGPLWLLRKHLSAADQKILWFLTSFLLVAGGIILFYLAYIENPIVHITPGATFRTWQDYALSNIAPFVFLAPLGFIYLILKTEKIRVGIFLLLVFSFLSLLLAFNNLFGFDIWTNRLHTYLILSICIFSAVIVLPLTEFIIKRPLARSVVIVLILAITTYITWESQQKLYGSYATLNHYTGLDRIERKAVEWTRDNLPSGSKIITTNKQNRNAEWIPVLTPHRHIVWVPDHDFFSMTEKELEGRAKNLAGQYFLFLLRREEAPRNMLDRPDIFTVVYSNSGAVIFKVNEINYDIEE